MATITEGTNRFGERVWLVVWGKGLTQTAVALTYSEAVALLQGKRKTVEPLVAFKEVR